MPAIIKLKLLQDAQHIQDFNLIWLERALDSAASRLDIGRFNHRKLPPWRYHSAYSSIENIRCSGRRTGRRSRTIVLQIKVFEV